MPSGQKTTDSRPRPLRSDRVGTAIDHFAVLVEQPLAEVKDRLGDAGVERETEAVREGAVGELPCVYVTDPAGYTVEFKSRRRA